MKATATRTAGFKHAISVRTHQLTADEPAEHGGDDAAPSPQELLAASLASCTAVTMEMYAKRKGWDIGDVEVVAEYTPAERGSVTRFQLSCACPRASTPRRSRSCKIIAAKCPVHRTLDGEVMFDEKIELV